MKLLLVAIAFFMASVSTAQNETVGSFSEAKRLLSKNLDKTGKTIYCQCEFKGNKVDLSTCGYKVQKDKKRALRVEFEHVVPAEAFGNSFSEWRNGASHCKKKGRKCAGTNKEFAKMEADLYNLFPEIGELNGLRSNYSMAQIAGSSGKFGSCDVKLEGRKFEPNDKAKGVVARAYKYMHDAYPGRGIISNKNEKLFEAWDKMHPVQKWECDRARMIEKIQGNGNKFILEPCKKAGL